LNSGYRFTGAVPDPIAVQVKDQFLERARCLLRGGRPKNCLDDCFNSHNNSSIDVHLRRDGMRAGAARQGADTSADEAVVVATGRQSLVTGPEADRHIVPNAFPTRCFSANWSNSHQPDAHADTNETNRSPEDIRL
jgi:hypothetical protein